MLAHPQRITRQALTQNSQCLVVERCLTHQFSRTFVPSSVHLWNSLPDDVVVASSVDVFKYRLNKYLI